MSNSSRKAFEVFEFKEEDELIELSAGRFTGKFRNPKSDKSPLTKYTFLQCFAGGTNHQKVETSEVLCIDVDTSNSGHKCRSHGSCALDILRGTSAATKGISVVDEILVSNSIHDKPHALTNPDNTDSENIFSEGLRVNSRELEGSSLRVPSADNDQSNSILPELPSENDLIDLIPDDDKIVKASSLSSYSSDIGSLEDSASDNYYSGLEMENIDQAVFVTPDHLIYGDRYCTESLLTFSCSGIKLQGKKAYGDKESFTSEWAIAEITSIVSHWFVRVETALIKLYVSLGDEIEDANVDETSGILEVKFAVYDPYWSGKQERIMSMDAKYNGIWKLVLDNDASEYGFVGMDQIYFSKGYFPNFDEPFEDVIYPKGDPDAVSISKRDVELLQPETFINDTIIDFYIKYLENKLQPEDRQRFHFFNSFFFRKLADLDKDPSSASQGRAAFQRVRKWTRKVNLFEKDYIFIPVNFNLHWSLIVICHPGEVAKFEDEDVSKSLKVPCILHMDSIKGSHKGLKNLVQSYLWEEWKERKTESSEEISSKFLNLRFVPLELPQQENSFDCGLFLLHYAELFLEEGPVCFNPFKITRFSNFLNRDWFPPAEASLKRVFIQKLIYELLGDHYQKITTDVTKDEHKSFEVTENNNGKEKCVEFLSENRRQAKGCHGNSSCSTASQGIEIELLATSTGAHCSRDPQLVFRELLEPGTTEGSFLNRQYGPSYQLEPFHRFKSAASPIQEEDPETGDKFAPSGEAGFQALKGITAGACSTSFSTKGHGIFDSYWNPGISIPDDKQETGDLSTDSSSCDSRSTSEIGEDEHLPISGFVYSGKQVETDKPRSVSPENVWCITGSPASASSSERLEACVVEDSQEEDTVAESKESKESNLSCPENISASAHKEADYDVKKNELSGDDPTLESDEQPAMKRLKHAALLEGKTPCMQV